jgi:hypothetical protein
VWNHVRMRRFAPWLTAVPLALVGTLAGHAVGYRAAVPDSHERAHVLAATGHGYLTYAPLVVALCVALVVLGFAAMVSAAVRGRAHAGSSRIGFVAALPPLAFLLQETLERYVEHGHVHWAFLVSAPVLLGLATQVPFALLAAAIAFALTVAAVRIAQAVAAAPRPRVAPTAFLAWPGVDLPLRPVLARGYPSRGPPRIR